MWLGDMGADVIKIERPEHGDDARTWGPPFVNGESAWFMSANRNKRSVCLNIKKPSGFKVLLDLLATADVFIENLNPSKLEAVGLSPEVIMARFPRLIFCSISGFGLTGDDKDLPGYDLIAQARSGLMSVTGERDRSPQRVSTALSDVAAAMLASFTISAALVRQQRTGVGELIDIALLDADLAFMSPRISSFLAGDDEPQPSGATDSVLAVYQSFLTADRPIVVAVGNDAMWHRFCQAVDLPELSAAVDYRTNSGRRKHRDTLIRTIQECLLGSDAASWLKSLHAAGVPASLINSTSEVVNSAHVRTRANITTLQHSVAGPIKVVDSPWKLGSQNHQPIKHSSPPMLGQDTFAVLGEIGYQQKDVEQLMTDGSVWAPTNS